VRIDHYQKTRDAARNIIEMAKKPVRTKTFETHAGVHQYRALRGCRVVSKGKSPPGEFLKGTDTAVTARDRHELKGTMTSDYGFGEQAHLPGLLRADVADRCEVGDIQLSGCQVIDGRVVVA
jgi:hypothetical protein